MPFGMPGNTSIIDATTKPIIIRYVCLGFLVRSVSSSLVIATTPNITPNASGIKNAKSSVLTASIKGSNKPNVKSKNEVEIPGNINAIDTTIPAINKYMYKP